MISVWISFSHVWNQPELTVMSRGSVENEYTSVWPGSVPPATGAPFVSFRSHSTGSPEQQLIVHGGIPSGAAMSAMSGTKTGRASSKPENPLLVGGSGSYV